MIKVNFAKFTKIFKFDLQKYFEISTIGGVFYLSRRFHFFERYIFISSLPLKKLKINYFGKFRTFWLITLASFFVCTAILIGQFVIKIQNFPIVSYLSDQTIPVSDV